MITCFVKGGRLYSFWGEGVEVSEITVCFFVRYEDFGGNRACRVQADSHASQVSVFIGRSVGSNTISGFLVTKGRCRFPGRVTAPCQ